STRSPRASALLISSKIVATMVSTSAPRRCGLAAASSAISSDLVTSRPYQLLSGTVPDGPRTVKTNTLGNQHFPKHVQAWRQAAQQRAADKAARAEVVHRKVGADAMFFRQPCAGLLLPADLVNEAKPQGLPAGV